MSDDEFSDWAREHSPVLLRRATLLCGDRNRRRTWCRRRWSGSSCTGTGSTWTATRVGYAHTTLFRLFVSGRRRRSSGELPTAALPERAGAGADVESHLDLVAALQTLPPRQRCVVVARYVDDRSVSEVARLMRRTEGWVRVTASRALHQLRDSPLVAGAAPDYLARRA